MTELISFTALLNRVNVWTKAQQFKQVNLINQGGGPDPYMISDSSVQSLSLLGHLQVADGFNIGLRDNSRLNLGTDEDARLYFDGSKTVIESDDYINLSAPYFTFDNVIYAHGIYNYSYLSIVNNNPVISLKETDTSHSEFQVQVNGGFMRFYHKDDSTSPATYTLAWKFNKTYADMYIPLNLYSYLLLKDTQRLNLGTDADAYLYHDNSDVYFTNTNGDMLLYSRGGSFKVITGDYFQVLDEDDAEVVLFNLSTSGRNVTIGQVSDPVSTWLNGDLHMNNHVIYKVDKMDISDPSLESAISEGILLPYGASSPYSYLYISGVESAKVIHQVNDSTDFRTIFRNIGAGMHDIQVEGNIYSQMSVRDVVDESAGLQFGTGNSGDKTVSLPVTDSYMMVKKKQQTFLTLRNNVSSAVDFTVYYSINYGSSWVNLGTKSIASLDTATWTIPTINTAEGGTISYKVETACTNWDDVSSTTKCFMRGYAIQYNPQVIP